MTHAILLPNGKYHALTRMKPEPAYTIETIAHQLAQIVRFTGAASRPYSVAEHSLLCVDIAEAHGHGALVQMCCLMHDAHESVTGDVSSPVKWTVGHPWSCFENVEAHDLRVHFRLCTGFAGYRNTIRNIDLIALATERRDLMPFSHDTHESWPILDTPGQVVDPHPTNLQSLKREQMHWTEWRDKFLEIHEQLSAELDNEFQHLAEVRR